MGKFGQKPDPKCCVALFGKDSHLLLGKILSLNKYGVLEVLGLSGPRLLAGSPLGIVLRSFGRVTHAKAIG